MTRAIHPSARTTLAMRRAIKKSDEPIRAIAERLGVNPKTVVKWRARGSVEDAPKGPKEVASSVLSLAAEALIVVYRRRMKCSIDDCYRALRGVIPHLSRSALHRCLKRHGLGRIPRGNTQKLAFAEKPSTYFSMELYELPPNLGGGFLFLAVGDCNTLLFAETATGNLEQEAAKLLYDVKEKSPIRVVYTSRCAAFVADEKRPWDPAHPDWVHPFHRACRLCQVQSIIVRGSARKPVKVHKGWRGAELKSFAEIFMAKRTLHYWRLVKAEADRDLDLSIAGAVERRLAAVTAGKESEKKSKAGAKKAVQAAPTAEAATDKAESETSPEAASPTKAESAKPGKGGPAKSPVAKTMSLEAEIDELFKMAERLLDLETSWAPLGSSGPKKP
jgi:hypothetical protein